MGTAYMLVAMIYGQSSIVQSISNVGTFPTEKACVTAMDSILEALPDADRSVFMCLNAETGRSQIQEITEGL